MKIQKWTRLAILLAAVGAAGGASAAGDAARGKQLGFTCLGCHGVPTYETVYPTYHVPRLGGQHPDYLVSALKEYRAGQRQHPTMQAQASSMSDQDMEDLAAYFSTYPVK